jgi:hypothetical protein
MKTTSFGFAQVQAVSRDWLHPRCVFDRAGDKDVDPHLQAIPASDVKYWQQVGCVYALGLIAFANRASAVVKVLDSL